MKKMKGFRALLALLLTVIMVFSSMTVFADTPQTQTEVVAKDKDGDVIPEGSQSGEYISYGDYSTEFIQVDITNVNENTTVIINGEKVSAGNTCAIHVEDNEGGLGIYTTDIITSETADGIKIEDNHGNIDITKSQRLDIKGGSDGVNIKENSGNVYIAAESVNGTNGDGFCLSENSSDSTVALWAGDVSGGENGIGIQNNAGTVNINQKTEKDYSNNNKLTETTITGVKTGINIQNNTGTITSNQGEYATPGDVNGTDKDGILINGNRGGKTIDLTHNDVTGGNNGIEIQSNVGTINIDANTVTGNDRDGIAVSPDDNNPSSFNAGIINLNVGDTEGKHNGILIYENRADVNINQKTKMDQNNQPTETCIHGNNGIRIDSNNGIINMNQENSTPGDITGDYYGIIVSRNQKNINLTAGKITSGTYGISISADSGQGGASNAVNVESVDSAACGVDVNSSTASDKTSVTVNGKVSAVSDKSETECVSTSGSGITVRAGEVFASTAGSGASAVGLSMSGGTVIVEENEDHEDATGDVTATSTNGGTAYGLVLKGDNKSDVVVEGTLYGDDAAISLHESPYGDSYGGNAELTVWKLETEEDGKLVSGDDANGSFAAAINYIVKVAKSAASLLTISGTEKTVTIGEGEEAENLSWQTAKAGEDVTVTVDLDEGEALDSLYYYYDDEQKKGTGELTIKDGTLEAVANAINTFKVKMQEAGGMLLGLAKHKHEYNAVVTEPTCTEPGYTTHTCSICGDNYTDTPTKALNHDYKAVVTEPTCTEPGFTTHTCSRCQNKYTDTPTKAKGHTEVTDAAVAATCTTAGKTAGSHCSVCNTVINAQTVIPAKGHKEVTDAAVAATCTKTGLTEGSHCSVCGEVLKAQETVPAKGHSPAAAVKENEKAAKIGVAGSYDEVVYCKDCGAEINRKTVTVPALPEEKKEEDVKTAETATDKAEITAAAVTVDAFDAFCNELARKIRNAPQNGTLEADAGDFPGLKQVVFKALEDRSDVSLKLKIRNGETILIPAGAGLLSKVGTGTVTWAEIRGLV